MQEKTKKNKKEVKVKAGDLKPAKDTKGGGSGGTRGGGGTLGAGDHQTVGPLSNK
jgi:hypothetical protein